MDWFKDFKLINFMTHFVKLARQIINLDYGTSNMTEVKYDKYIEGFGYETFTEYFHTNIIAPITKFGFSRPYRFRLPLVGLPQVERKFLGILR